MLKTILAGTTALVIAGASLAYAQKAPDGPDRADRWRPTAQDMAAFGDARIAALRAGLKLTPEQEKNWPAVETALRDAAKQRADRFAARASADKPAKPADPIERLNRRADRMTQTGASLKKIADAAGPLYKSLDDSQKRRFTMLAQLEGKRFFGREHRGHGHGHRHHGPRHDRGHHGPAGAPEAPKPL